MTIQKRFHYWLEQTADEPVEQQELQAIKDNQQQITDRFFKNLDFGTGGLRGVMEMGDNRINRYTIRRATQGLANYLLQPKQPAKVVIAYDSRNHSKTFATEAALVLAANQIQVFLAPAIMPTPLLSFCVRAYQANAGIVITASHNPKEYNGYKVYNQFGVQITSQMAAAILKEMDVLDLFQDIQIVPSSLLTHHPLITDIDPQMLADYYRQVKQLVLRNDLISHNSHELKLLYTPLHGAGLEPLPVVLTQLGFDLELVTEQCSFDGDFSTVHTPNPEEPEVFTLALKQAQEAGQSYDLLLATDPDCDRIGIMVKHQGSYQRLNGNEVGALLCHYLLSTHQELATMPRQPAVVKTIVTSDLAKKICQQYDVSLFETLTGFKYIGELLEEWSISNEYQLLLGFEESFGYLAGDFVRDKDAIIAATLIAEMTLYYKHQKMTLIDQLESLFKQFGYYKEGLLSITKTGSAGAQEIKTFISDIRKHAKILFRENGLIAIEDYSISLKSDLRKHQTTTLDLPPSDVIKLFFEDGSWVVIRPSGTEPKIKLYIAVTADDRNTLQQTFDRYKSKLLQLLSS